MSDRPDILADHDPMMEELIGHAIGVHGCGAIRALFEWCQREAVRRATPAGGLALPPGETMTATIDYGAVIEERRADFHRLHDSHHTMTDDEFAAIVAGHASEGG